MTPTKYVAEMELCGCGAILTEKDLKQAYNEKYKDKMCLECFADYAEHVATGD